ncbi:MAG: hypothetical protein HUU38_18140 [Anaerolineales bacterium]|nr:hypothetical protein [Anaerolineales bacterium]
MKQITRILRSKATATLLVVLGVGLILFFGWRALHVFRQMPPLPPRPPKPIEVEDGIRPWMNIKYISKVYAVPPEYLSHYLNLPPLTNIGRPSLEELNETLELGNTENGEPVITQRIEWAIQEFYAHPDFRQTRLVAPTMSIHFIATETEIPEATLFEALGLPQAGNEYTSLEVLSQEQNYAGGVEALVQTLQHLVNTSEGE